MFLIKDSRFIVIVEKTQKISRLTMIRKYKMLYPSITLALGRKYSAKSRGLILKALKIDI